MSAWHFGLGFVALGLVACATGTDERRETHTTSASSIERLYREFPHAFADARARPPAILVRDSERVVLRSRAPVTRPAHAVLPTTSDAAFRVGDATTAMSIEVGLDGAQNGRGLFGQNSAFYADALGSGRDRAIVVHAEGIEDFVRFPEQPAREELRYHLDVSSVAGLRLVDGVLELVDAGGIPRLRVPRPAVFDNRDREHRARTRVEGCGFDSSPRAPWGRPPTPPGNSLCTLVVEWQLDAHAYPALIDPGWTTTGSLAKARSHHGSVALQNGAVVLSASGNNETSAELYQTSSGTWSVTAPVSAAMNGPVAAAIDSDRALFVGADGPTGPGSELYSLSAGTWTPYSTARRVLHAGALMPDGSGVIVCGGILFTAPITYANDCQRFDVANKSWGAFGSLPSSGRYGLSMAADFSSVIVTGGRIISTLLPIRGEIFRFDGTDWVQIGSLKKPRWSHLSVSVPSGGVLAAGGYSDASSPPNVSADAELVATNGSSTLMTPSSGHTEGSLTLMSGGRVLWAGGESISGAETAAAEVFHPTGIFGSTTSMSTTRAAHAAARLSDGRVLVNGGRDVNDILLASAELFGLGVDGSPCGANGDCESAKCVDGVCCNVVCSDVCLACSKAKKGFGIDGKCEPIAVGSDPDDDCADLGAGQCSKNGSCDGAGACQTYAVGAKCIPDTCQNGVLLWTTCAGVGQCSTQMQKSCSPYACASATACATSCTGDGDCATGNFCSAGACVKKKNPGDGCNAATQCASGFCVESVCCAEACAGCKSCLAINKADGSADGSCGLAKAGVDPLSACPDDGAPSCKRDGTCDGLGGCRLYLAGIACGVTGCVANVQKGYACDGAGACLADQSVDCGLFSCQAGACPLTCSTSSDCTGDAYCAAGVCVPKLSNGGQCQTADECTSSLCVDGVCCNAPCLGQCEACSVAGSEGTCRPVVGSPVGLRPACDKGNGSDACSAKQCDGITRGACEAYVGESVTCRVPSCSAGVETFEGHCNASGTCPLPVTKACTPYLCASDTICGTQCGSSADCEKGTSCSSGKCIATASCDGDHTVTGATGVPEDCAPYKCNDQGCRSTCSTVSDCVTGFVCDGTKHCVRTEHESSDTGGCGCRSAGSRGTPNALFALIGLGVCLVVRRRHAMLAALLGMACSNGREHSSPDPPNPDDPIAHARLERTRLRFGAFEERADLPSGRPARAFIALDAASAQRLIDETSKIEASITLEGTASVRARVADGLHVYPDAVGAGNDVIIRPLKDGFEDFVTFEHAPAVSELRYRIDVSHVAGLRLVDRVLELLDADGAPRLRAAEPFVLDRLGRKQPAHVNVVGCAYDASPRAPWNRPVTHPGAAICTLVVSWTIDAGDYPALVDPSWTTTGSLSVGRVNHTCTPLAGGTRVLLAGGTPTETELYDVTTGTWATTGALSGSISSGSATALDSDRVLLVGAAAQTATTGVGAELYSLSLGTWTPIPTTPRWGNAAVLAQDGKSVIVCGGFSSAVIQSSCTSLDVATLSWGAFPGTNSPMAQHAMALQAGAPVIAGGRFNNSTGVVKSVFRFDGTKWNLFTSLTTTRYLHRMIELPGGGNVLLVAGGAQNFSVPLIAVTAADLIATDGTVTLVQQKDGHLGGSLSLLPSGRALLAGGATINTTANPTPELFDPASGSFVPVGDLNVARYNHAAAVLSTGAVLVAGGSPTAALASAELFAPILNGAACSRDGDCKTLHCADGVCCDSACTGTCVACTKSKTGAAEGVCAAITQGSDPDAECTDVGAALCGTTGNCNGAGACELYPVGTECQTKTCVNGVLVWYTCTGLGQCSQAQQQSCAPASCGSPTSCGTTCTKDDECASGAYCGTGSCLNKKANGTVCVAEKECASGFCLEGVCCDQPCTGCNSCRQASKTDGSPDGTCGLASAGVDPYDACPDDGATSCDRDGTCDGKGACRFYASGTACGATACAGNVQQGYACDGTGACLSDQVTPCSPFACKVDQCTTACIADQDCVPSAYCAAPTCTAKKANSDKCQAAIECASGFCVDGTCCNLACTGQCEACDAEGAHGICVPVAGAPHSNRPACEAATGSDPCSAKRCDGIEPTSCAGSAGSDVICVAASCKDGLQSFETRCNATGKCPAAETKKCSPFACASATECAGACKTDTDCEKGTHCNTATGKCSTGTSCDGDHRVTLADGTVKDCSPYRCGASGCLSTCSKTEDCVAGSVCDEHSQCTQPKTPETTSDDAGCGCRSPGSRRTPNTLLLAAVAGLIGAAGARRRASA